MCSGVASALPAQWETEVCENIKRRMLRSQITALSKRVREALASILEEAVRDVREERAQVSQLTEAERLRAEIEETYYAVNSILPGELFVSSDNYSRDQLMAMNIRTVVRVVGVSERKEVSFPSCVELSLNYDIRDSPREDIMSSLPRILEVMRTAPKPILVHCVAGVSRSPTIAIAYVSRERGLGILDALRIVLRGRLCSRPNVGFLAQLFTFTNTNLTVGDISIPIWEVTSEGDTQ